MDHIHPQSFEPQSVIGEGGFGKVVVATYKDNHYAVKLLRRQSLCHKEDAGFLFERMSLTRLNDERFVQAKFCFATSDHYYLVLDYCLCNFRFVSCTRLQAAYFAMQLSNAIKALHDEYNIIHHDIKPENMLLTVNRELKVADFGEALHIRYPRKIGLTTAFAAPEALSCYLQDALPDPSPKADIWSLAATMYSLFTSQDLFESYEEDMLQFQIFCEKQNNLDALLETKLKRMPHLRPIQNMLRSNPSERVYLSDVVDPPKIFSKAASSSHDDIVAELVLTPQREKALDDEAIGLFESTSISKPGDGVYYNSDTHGCSSTPRTLGRFGKLPEWYVIPSIHAKHPKGYYNRKPSTPTSLNTRRRAMT